METCKILSELYEKLTSLEEPHLAKHTISALILGVFDKLESSSTEITPKAIEATLKEELEHFVLKSPKKKKSA